MLVTLVFAAIPTFAQNGVLPNFDPTCTPLVHLISQNYTSGTQYNTMGLEPEYPIWCYPQPQAGPATAIKGPNSWVDTWDNDHPAIQTLNDGDYDYRVFPRLLSDQSRFKWGAFINSDHWMVDLVDVSPFRLSGGILISPDQTFQFVNGKIVVEADAAAGAPGMGSADHYYEIDITPALAPTNEPNGGVVDALYGYGQFGGVGAIGCRFEGGFICTMYDDSNRVTGGQCPQGHICKDNGGRPGRVWETQGVGTARTAPSVRGGFGQEALLLDGPGRLGDVWRHCGDNIHDLHCRDRFRIELTKTNLKIYVNGRLGYEIDGLYAVNPETGADNRVPDSWFQSGVRMYMTSWINGGQHTPLRWHWNNVAVNPPYPASEAVSDSYCAGQTAGGSPNTCPHAHVQSCPELAPPGTISCSQTNPTPEPTSIPTQIPPTQTPIPTNTVVPTATPEPTPTATPTSPTCQTVWVRLEGFPEQPVTFCKATAEELDMLQLMVPVQLP